MKEICLGKMLESAKKNQLKLIYALIIFAPVRVLCGQSFYDFSNGS